MRTLATRLLLGFVLVTIGFALGQERARRRLAADAATPAATVAAAVAPAVATAAGPRLVVHFMHGTLRCATCNQIERQTRQAVEQAFAPQLASGQIILRDSNFDQEPGLTLANRYDVTGSVIVLTRLDPQGRELGFKRLDEVWTRIEEPPAAFAAFIRAEIERQWAEATP